jgi:hypothetical protein
MVATTVDLTDLCAVAAATAGIDERRKARRRVGARRELRLAGPTELGVYRLDSAALIDQARRLHADTYLHHRYHTADSIDGEGLLVDTIDPPEVVARSTYLGVFDDEGLLAGSIRMIRPVGDDAATLPTLEKLAHRDASGSAVTKPPFRPGSVIFEVSALAKASRCHDRTITTRLLLAVVSEARRCGDDYGVMGVVANTAKLLMAVYGQQAIRPLTGDVGAITLTGTGIRPGGLTLVPCYAETATFVGDLRAYCLARPHHPLTRLNLPLIEATAAAFSSEHRAGSSRIVRARAA